MGANVEINVTYVEPHGAAPGGVRTLGHYVMTVPPRKGETVVLEPTFRADLARYRVEEVIHHMPKSGEDARVMEVTILAVPILTSQDIDRVMSSLCHPDHINRLAASRGSSGA